jgi:hypothetical protein
VAVTVEGSGTQTAVISTEHELYKSSAAKVFALLVDSAAMVSADVLELRIYARLLNGGAERLVQVAIYSNAQVEIIKQSIPFPATGLATDGFRATLKQVAGTGRAFPWAVVSV